MTVKAAQTTIQPWNRRAGAAEPASSDTVRSVPALRKCAGGDASSLHAPFAHGPGLDGAEHHALHQQPDQYHREEAGKHVGDLELVAILENIPAKPARARAHSEY